MIQYRRALLLLTIFLSSFAAYSQLRNEWIDYSKTYYKFKINNFGTDGSTVPWPNIVWHSGIVKIPYATLQSAGLGSVPAEHFQLWRNGEEVPIYISTATGTLSSSDYIEFWGRCNDGKLDNSLYRNSEEQLNDFWSLQTDSANYFLTVNTAGNNKRLVNTLNNVANTALPADSFFRHSSYRYFRAQINEGFAASAGQNLYSSSYDRGEGWTSRRIRPNGNLCGGQAQLPQNFPNVYPYLNGPDATYKINMIGNAQNSRNVHISFNGDSLTTVQMDYFGDARLEGPIPMSKFTPGYANFLFINQSQVDCDEFKIAKVEVIYSRQFNFGGDSTFEFTLDSSSAGRHLKILNFVHRGNAPVLLDLTNGKRYIADISTPDTVRILLEPSSEPYRLVLYKPGITRSFTINSVKQKNFINFADTANQGDYIIITNTILYDTSSSNPVTQYKNYRSTPQGGGYDVLIVDQEELTDQFAYGIKKHPISIRNFSRFARNNFIIQPKYFFLIGKGVIYITPDAGGSQQRTNDQADSETLNLVPTWGAPASDNLLTAENNTSPAPVIPVGRLSVVSKQELSDYLQKVIQYEAAQNDTVHNLANKGWMKTVLQVTGANDAILGGELDGYMHQYKNIIADTLFGANVTNFSKTANPASYSQDVQSFKNIYEKGSSLLQYFGHSSSTALDFNLDNPENYNNQGKYPLFIVNGCNAGNFYLLEGNRLNNKTTISEKYVLAPQRGAIGFIASTHFGIVNYLDNYTSNIYTALSKTKYGAGISEILKEGLTQTLVSLGTSDYYARVHAEQTGYHGDPALRLNTFLQPDYAIDSNELVISPSFISVADDSFTVRAKIYNLGKAVNDSVDFKILRTYPNGSTKTVYTIKLPGIKYADSVIVKIPVIGNTEKGNNTITVVIDYPDLFTELSEENNTTSKQIVISEDEVRPIYPYNYAIISASTVSLKASTVNPFSASRQYKMEFDTTALFNSLFKTSATVTSVGGVIEYPAISLNDDVTYYWRISPADLSTPHWNTFSFIRRAGSDGFQQQHIHQRTQVTFDRISLDSTTQQYSFNNKTNNLFITHSIYPTSGTEDAHFSIAVNGSAFITSACVGSSIIFNVFDTLTFRPWRNITGNDYQSGIGGNGLCNNSGREYNFEFSTQDSANRRRAMQFMDMIPNGMYVVVRKVYDQGNTDWAPSVWAADESVYGAGNSLYHRLQGQSLPINQFTFPRTFVFIYKKNDANFTPVSAFSEGLYDRITLSKDIQTKDTLGYITSPKFGPAKTWKNVIWSGSGDANDAATLDVIGIDASHKDSLLYTLTAAQQNFSIASVSATEFPYIKLKLKNQDPITATPYQLSLWRLEYDAVPEGAIAPNLHFVPSADSAGADITAPSDSIHLSVGFKNISNASFDSLTVKAVLYDSTYTTAYTFQLPKTRTLIAGDTLHVKIDAGVLQFPTGMYNLLVDVNPNILPEQFRFNNFIYRQVYIKNQYPQACTGGSIYFTAQTQGSSYQWQVSTDSMNFTNITNNSNYTGANARTLQVNGLQGSAYGYQYRCVVDGNTDEAYTLKFTNYWNGKVNTLWENSGNWNCGNIPDQHSDVYINSGNVSINSNVTLRSLILGPGVNLTIAPGYTLTLLK